MRQETAIVRVRTTAISLAFVGMFIATIGSVIYAMSSGAAL